MTPAEFRAAKAARIRIPWSDDRVRDELAKAMQSARDALERGVHVHVPPHAVERVREIARCGGWSAVQAKKPDTQGNVRVTFTAGPESMIDLTRFLGELHTTTGGRVLYTAADHTRFIEESKPIQPTVATKLVDDALAASLLAADDDVPAVWVRRHSVQQVVDAAASQGWHCYVAHRTRWTDAIPADVGPNDDVQLGLFGEPLTLPDGATLLPLVPTPRAPRVKNDDSCDGHESVVVRPEHTFAEASCGRCGEDERRSPDRG